MIYSIYSALCFISLTNSFFFCEKVSIKCIQQQKTAISKFRTSDLYCKWFLSKKNAAGDITARGPCHTSQELQNRKIYMLRLDNIKHVTLDYFILYSNSWHCGGGGSWRKKKKILKHCVQYFAIQFSSVQLYFQILILLPILPEALWVTWNLKCPMARRTGVDANVLHRERKMKKMGICCIITLEKQQ